MLNKTNPLAEQQRAIELQQRCEEGDLEACRLLSTMTLSAPKLTMGYAEGGSLLSPEGMGVEEGPSDYSALMDVLGPEQWEEVQAAMEQYPAVGVLADMATFQTDGQVDGMGGPKSDEVPARLSEGEYVLPAEVVAIIGVENLDRLVEEAKQTAASM